MDFGSYNRTLGLRHSGHTGRRTEERLCENSRVPRTYVFRRKDRIERRQKSGRRIFWEGDLKDRLGVGRGVRRGVDSVGEFSEKNIHQLITNIVNSE